MCLMMYRLGTKDVVIDKVLMYMSCCCDFCVILIESHCYGFLNNDSRVDDRQSLIDTKTCLHERTYIYTSTRSL